MPTILDLRPTGYTYTATLVGRVTFVSAAPYDVTVKNKGPTTIFKVHVTDKETTVELTCWGVPSHIGLFALDQIVVLTNLRVTALEERFRLFHCGVQVHYGTASKVRAATTTESADLGSLLPHESFPAYIAPSALGGTDSLATHLASPGDSPSKTPRRSADDSPGSTRLVAMFPPVLCLVCGKDERTVPFCCDAEEPYTPHTKRCTRCGCTKQEHKFCEHTGAPHD